LYQSRMVNAPSTSNQSKPSKSAFKNYFSSSFSSLIYRTLYFTDSSSSDWCRSIFWRWNVDFNHLATILQTVLGTSQLCLLHQMVDR